ncbi:MAG: hypothetical protein H6710_10285 [Myxococcales bacterium]|nr:hypothetical protein [Myxococcales bacterium]MCB9700546.1 hypothetical protein [Myxococcales bacterium]
MNLVAMSIQRSFSPTTYKISRYSPPLKHSGYERFLFSGSIRLPNPDQSASSPKLPKARALAVYFVVDEVTDLLPTPRFNFDTGEVVAYVHEREWSAWVDLVRNEKPLSVGVIYWSENLTTVDLSTGAESVGEGDG